MDFGLPDYVTQAVNLPSGAPSQGRAFPGGPPVQYYRIEESGLREMIRSERETSTWRRRQRGVSL